MMKQVMFIGALAIALGAGNVWAQQQPAAAGAAAGHTAPKTQPTTAPDPTIAAGDLALGSVSLGKAVKADGKPLPVGTYQVRLTAEQASSAAPGQTKASERWVEFVRGGKVVGREVVTIVPQAVDTPIFEHAANYTGFQGSQTSPFFHQPTNVTGMRKIDVGLNFSF